MKNKSRLEKLEKNSPGEIISEEETIAKMKEEFKNRTFVTAEDVEKIDWKKLSSADEEEINNAYNILYHKSTDEGELKEKEENENEKI